MIPCVYILSLDAGEGSGTQAGQQGEVIYQGQGEEQAAILQNATKLASQVFLLREIISRSLCTKIMPDPRNRMSLFRSRLFLLLFLVAAPVLIAQNQASAPSVPLPAPILSAQKVFLANGGAAPVLAQAFSKAGLTNEPYSSFYPALRNWGNWTILSSPEGADLVLVVSAEASPDTYYKGMPNYDLGLELRIIDGKTRLPLWTLSQPLEGAFRKSTFETNYRSSITGLIKQLKQLAPPRPQTP